MESNQVKLFIIDFDDFDTATLASELQGLGVELGNYAEIRQEKLFSLFIRYKVLKEYLKLPDIEFAVNKHNKPYLKNNARKYFNISHTKNHIVMAIADTEIGVDIEELISKKSFLNIAERYFSENEVKELKQSINLTKDFYTLWTLKEAQVKQSSLGIAYGFKEALFFKKNNHWVSNSYGSDFLTYSYKNSVISLCCAGVTGAAVNLLKITNTSIVSTTIEQLNTE